MSLSNNLNLQKRIWIGTGLACLPLISYVLSSYLAAMNGELAQLSDNFAISYLDFIFVFFNFLVPFVININWKLALRIFMLNLVIVGAITYFFWGFSFGVSIVHLVYSSSQIMLIAYVLFAEWNNKALSKLTILF